jgi:FkbM family methyltransferase
MIDPKSRVSYSQYNEDIILSALFSNVKKGYYVDVGANDPTIDSVTKIFYEQGWSGINVEPLKGLFLKLKDQRPRDINLWAGLGEKNGSAVLREYSKMSGHSTFDKKQKDSHAKNVKYVDYKVPIRTLKDTLVEYKPKHVHFMKIDVEGYEYQVIKGNDWTKFRPEVICVESNHIVSNWKAILENNQYKLFISDGLNEYYIADESWSRTNEFAEQAVLVSYHTLKQHQYQSWAKDSSDLVNLHALIKSERHVNKRELRKLQNLSALSLRNQPYLTRIKRALYGLSIDWLRYKKTK